MKLIPEKILVFIFCLCLAKTYAQGNSRAFNVIAFYNAKDDAAHISFVHEANKWFLKISREYNFVYDSTNNWNSLNTSFLSNYQVVLFLDARPEDSTQRAAFEWYMKNGGAWMGFLFAGFALTSSKYPENRVWYYN